MIKGQVVAVPDLTVGQTKMMFGIMSEHYDNLSEGGFYTDLLQKKDCVLFCDEDGGIHGFTTLAIYMQDGCQLLFSGDTIIEPEYWGKHDLAQVWLKNAFRYADEYQGKTYWLLLTKGYKTYKFLHTFFNEFYPCVDGTSQDKLRKIVDDFGSGHYGDKFHDGVYTAGKDYLKDELSHISEQKLKDRHTAFFLEKNPNYALGDELVCVARLSRENLREVGRKKLGV